MPNFKTELSQNMQMEEYQKAYVHALASCCGWNFQPLNTPDYDGVDVKIFGRFKDGDVPCRPEIEVQLKSTTNLSVGDKVVKYQLRVENYNLLYGNHFSIPRYLFVLDLDEEPITWATLTDEALLLSKKCYWISLEKYGPIDNTSSITIEIPKDQVLTRESLNEIMKKSALGGEL